MIETDRIRLIPLDHKQLVYYLRKDSALERELGVEPSPRDLSPALAEAMAVSILPNVAAHWKNHLFYTLWTVLDKEHNRLVADLCFKGEPNSAGEIEIGYGTYAAFQRRGFMTEAVGALLDWAFEQANVRAVVAETDLTNTPSIRILRRHGFVITRETDHFYYWRLARSAWENRAR